jgi:hypothetical protein
MVSIAAISRDSLCEPLRRGAPAAAEYRNRYDSSRDGAATVAHERECNRPIARVRPNHSLKLTRYGRHCKPGLRYSVHCLSPDLQYLPPRAA